jgi:LysR family glycine cleavage system transcriptional activator
LTVTAKWLVPRVAGFQQAHPDIDLHLHASDLVVDLNANPVDLAIRYGTGPYPGLIAEPLLADRFAPVANPVLGIRTCEDLQQATLIHFDWKRADNANPTWPGWFRAAGMDAPESVSRLTFSDESHAIQAAVAGQGAALLSLVLVADELAAGHLVQPFGPTIEGMTYHLVEPSDRPRSAQVTAARHWLLSELRGSA